MEIQLHPIKLKTFDALNPAHIEALHKMSQDETMDPFYNQNLRSVFTQMHDGQSLTGNYLVYLGDQLLFGFLRILEAAPGCLELEYGIFKEYRNRKLSIALLQAVGTYIKQNHQDIHEIKLDINKENIPSMNCAKHCGYELENQQGDSCLYTHKL